MTERVLSEEDVNVIAAITDMGEFWNAGSTLIASHRALAKRVEELELTWTTDKPTVAGWYWWRQPTLSLIPVIVELDGPEDERLQWGGEWAGPIAEPKEGG